MSTISNNQDAVTVLQDVLSYLSGQPSTPGIPQIVPTKVVGTIIALAPEIGMFGPTGAVDVKFFLDTPPTDGTSQLRSFTFFKPGNIAQGDHGTLSVEPPPAHGDYDVFIGFVKG